MRAPTYLLALSLLWHRKRVADRDDSQQYGCCKGYRGNTFEPWHWTGKRGHNDRTSLCKREPELLVGG